MAVVVTTGWGALAFGAAYPWVSWPLMVACLVSALLVVMATDTPAPGAPLVALTALAAAIALQLVPLPPTMLALVSPATPGAIDLVAGPGTSAGAHALSVWPAATTRALALFLSLAVFFFGVTRLLAATGARWLLVSLTILAVVLAVAGLAQKALYNGLIYGLWAPEMSGSPFGPFVNKNHFAGWMLMALPLTLALVCHGISRGMRYVPPTLRDRLLWLGTRDASHVILAGGAALMMGIALVLTMSRSGISAFLLAVAVTAAFVVRGMHVRSRRSAAWLYLVGLAALVLFWVGVDSIVTRFSDADWSEFNGRLTSWSDTVGIASQFPLAGTGLNTFSLMAIVSPKDDPTQRFDQSHNDYLQLLSEGGLLLALPILLFGFVMARDVSRRFREDTREGFAWWARAGAVTGLLSIGLQETVEFSLQMPGNAVMFTLLCAIAVHRVRRTPLPRF